MISILFFMISMTVATKEIPIVLCGRQLANARVALCYGAKYVNDKRTSPEYIYDQLNNDLWNDPHLWDGKRGSLSAGWSRYKRTGLADECCLKPCLPQVILAYC